MSKAPRPKILYIPDSPNVGDAAPARAGASAGDQARADEIADKVSTGDELSGYEKVAGNGRTKGRSA